MKHTSSYAPDDAGIGVQSLEFLHGEAGKQLLQAVRALAEAAGEEKKGQSVAQIARLRKAYSAEHVHTALTLMRLQEKGAGARGKFPMLPFFWGTPEALEQATGAAVAQYKAARFAALKPDQIVDLCAGIGGDTLGLAAVAPTTAVDASAVRTTCLRYNLEEMAGLRHPPTVITEDIRNVLPSLPREALFHIDPSRRNGGKRSPRFEDLIPGPEVLEQVIQHFAGGAIKLSSAVDFDSLPSGHLELISHQRVVVQAVLWVGTMERRFPTGTRTASVLLEGRPGFSLTAPPRPAETAGEPPLVGSLPLKGRILYELDGALTRAGLAGPLASELRLRPLTTDGGYAIAMPDAVVISHPALIPFQVVDVIPYSPQRVAAALEALPNGVPGSVEVKTRGRLPGIEADKLQVAWTRAAPFRRTVLLFSSQKDVVAAIADRIPAVD